MKKMKKGLYYLLSALVTIGIFTTVFHIVQLSFSNTGNSSQLELSLEIERSRDFIEFLTVYGNHYLEAYEHSKESELYHLIQYDPDTNSYHLYGREPYTGESIGTLVGAGTVPSKGIAKAEMNLALNFNDYFRKFYRKITDVAWVYYTSEKNFSIMYPSCGREFAYTDTERIKHRPHYLVAKPENDPLRSVKWTDVFLDKGGKGLMVTLSSPIYYYDTFMGVISLDLSTNSIRKLLSNGYDCCLIDDKNTVIATNKNIDFSDGIKDFNDVMEISESQSQKIRDMKTGTTERIGTCYYYKTDFSAAPWTLVMKLSVFTIAVKSALFSLPVCIISILLLITLKEAENRKRAEEELRKIATTDKLTGLKNRYYLDSVIEKEFQVANNYNQHLSVVTFDLDHFKVVNDTWGHEVGDEMLKQTAKAAQNLIRKADSMIRIGGEEFIILLPQTDSRGAYHVAEKIRHELEINTHPVAGVCTASFGVAEMIHGEGYSNLYRRADEAMYMAKENGRNCVFSFESLEEYPFNSVIVEWNSNWNSSNQSINHQHRELLNIINEIMSLTRHAHYYYQAHQKVDMLLHHVSRHFKFEEQLLTEIDYSNLKEHLACHQRLSGEMLKIKDDYQNGRVNAAAFFSFTIRKLLIGHLIEEDIKYYPDIQKQN